MWSSSTNGNLGIGPSPFVTLIVPSLGNNPVVITLTATDRNGNVSTAQVNVTVNVNGLSLL